MESLFSLSPLSSLFPSPPIRAIAGKRWTKQAGVSELRGGGWLRHAGRHQLGQKHSSHQGAPRLSTSVYATFLQNRKFTAVQTSWWNLTTYSLFLSIEIFMCVWPGSQRQEGPQQEIPNLLLVRTRMTNTTYNDTITKIALHPDASCGFYSSL